MPLTLTRTNNVLLIQWDDGENRVNLDSLARWNEIVDEIEATEGPLAVVWTGTGKFFSNGLDLDRFGTDVSEMGATVDGLHRLFVRLLEIPAYVVAAINGHAFAAGAMLSLTADYRIMREDRGYWCLNEADIGLPLSREMGALVTGQIPARAAREAMYTARRFSAPEALQFGIVDEIAPEGNVLSRAVERATLVATKDRKVVTAHKRIIHGPVARSIGGASSD